MSKCLTCGEPGTQVASTGTTTWLGCPSCQTVWTTTAGDDVDSNPSAAGTSPAPTVSTWGQASLLRAALLGTVAALLAGAARMSMTPILGNAGAFLLFAPAVSLAAYAEGPVAGAVATVVSAAVGTYFHRLADGTIGVEGWDHVVLFVLVGALITTVSTISRRASQRLAAALWRAVVARAQAEAAARDKEEFLALIAHELRTPASVILGWAKILRDQSVPQQPMGRALDAMERSARIQSRLVTDMLECSRTRSGTLRLDRRQIQLSPIVESAIAHVRAESERRMPALDVRVMRPEPWIFGDDVRLHQVFVNVLSNAVKFTPTTGHIVVDVSRTNTMLHVRISDTGTGIAPDFLPHVFDRFRQASDTLGYSRRGLGLGLAVVRDLIERHEGHVAVESAGLGCGTTVTITLRVHNGSPLADDERRAATATSLA